MKTKLCLIEGCGRLEITRGLCAKCYGTARKYVSRGKFTWKQLEDLKMCEVAQVQMDSRFRQQLGNQLKKSTFIIKEK